MEYSDEFWKNYGGDVNTHDNGGYATTSHPDYFSNEEWWGICSLDKTESGLDERKPTKAYFTLKNLWRK